MTYGAANAMCNQWCTRYFDKTCWQNTPMMSSNSFRQHAGLSGSSRDRQWFTSRHLCRSTRGTLWLDLAASCTRLALVQPALSCLHLWAIMSDIPVLLSQKPGPCPTLLYEDLPCPISPPTPFTFNDIFPQLPHQS